MTRKVLAALLCTTLALTACGQAPQAEPKCSQDIVLYTKQPVTAEVEEESPQVKPDTASLSENVKGARVSVVLGCIHRTVRRPGSSIRETHKGTMS